MPRTCSICSRLDRQKIDTEIASGTPYRNIAAQFRVSASAISRHREHVAGAIRKAAGKREQSIGESVMARLEGLYDRAERILDNAERSGDGRLALAGIREVRETLGGLFALAVKSAEGRPPSERIEYGELLKRAAEFYGLMQSDSDEAQPD